MLRLDLELFWHETFSDHIISISGHTGRRVVPSCSSSFYYLQDNKYIFKVVLFSPPQRESLDTGCVTSSTVPKHCAAQVHSSDAALSGAERAAAALSAELRRVCHRRRHFRPWIALKKVGAVYPLGHGVTQRPQATPCWTFGATGNACLWFYQGGGEFYSMRK